MPPAKRESEAPELQQGLEAFEEPAPTFGQCDLELLRTSEHADVLVIAEGQEFPCHRAILAARSAWFKDRIAELIQMPEARPIIHINTHRIFEVELVLIFIYAGKCKINPDFADGEPSLISACIRVFDLGHDFSVPSLADYATDELGNHLSLALRMVCDLRLSHEQLANGRTEIQDRLRQCGFMASYIAGVEAANRSFKEGGEGRLRPFQMLVDFYIAGEEVLIMEPEMGLFFDDELVPAFFRLYFLTKRKGGARSRWMRSLVVKPPVVVGKRGLCCECGGGLKNLKETGGIGFVNPKSREVIYNQAHCVRCADKPKNHSDAGLVKWEVFNVKKE